MNTEKITWEDLFPVEAFGCACSKCGSSTHVVSDDRREVAEVLADKGWRRDGFCRIICPSCAEDGQ